MIKVFIVDDHMVVREGVKRIIDGTTDMEVAGEAGDGDEALRQILAGEYDVVLLDLALPGLPGMDVLRTLKIRKPALPILVLSMYPEEDYALRILKEGAQGYLTKESAPAELLRAILKVARGKRYISDSMSERLADQAAGKTEVAPHELLSNREYQVFRMIAAGKMVKEIARELSLAPNTVTSYRARVLEKMSIKTNADLIRYAVENHLIV